MGIVGAGMLNKKKMREIYYKYILFKVQIMLD